MTGNSLNTGKKVYLVDGRRSAFGKFGGSFKSTPTLDLCLAPAQELINDLKLDPKLIEQVILGNVIPATTETIYVSRHLALHLGLDQSKGAYNVNRLCGSGMQAILDATRLIKLGEHDCVLAGGVENMSLIPHLVYGSRFGTRYGSLKTVDFLLDTLTDNFTKTPMAITAENMADKYTVSRQECDEYSVHSHNKAVAARNDGFFEGEIASMKVRSREISVDEHVRENCSIDDLSSLRPSFKENGVVTAATASGIVDGASVVLVASEEFVQANNLSPLAEIIDGTVVGVDPNFMGIGPVPAIQNLLQRNSLSMKDIDLVEINEAFASQVISCAKELELPFEKLNVKGGAISIGHPLGATGSRITHTLARQLKLMDKGVGIASACIGGGQGISILLKNNV